jgi:hypothetical protein
LNDLFHIIALYGLFYCSNQPCKSQYFRMACKTG